MLALAFEGWAQCRLATDPDPSDEPRGVSGWTFAVAGEPDLDRILRLQPEGATRREPGPEIGVSVTRVERDAAVIEDSPVLGAKVDLLDDPVFDGRNGLAFEDTQEPIVPLHLHIEGGGVVVDRRHTDSTGRFISTVPGPPGLPPAGPAQAIGVASAADRARFRARRAEQLRDALSRAASPTEEAALRRRLRAFEPGAPGITTASLGFALPYAIPLAGSDALVEDPAGALGPIDARSPWMLRMTIGIWDADALCAYIDARLELASPDRP